MVNEAYAGSAHLALLSILALAVLQTVASGLTAVLFFTKRTSAPRFFVALNWFAVLFLSAVGIWTVAAGIHEDISTARLGGEITQTAFRALLWTSYILASKRVKATFVRRHSLSAPAIPADVPEAAS